jgi:hypothetical protein
MSRYKKFLIALSMSIAMLVAGAALAGPAVEVITNGDFETGDFAGWAATGQLAGSVTINDGTFDPPGSSGALAPISGTYDAMTSQGGPALNMFRQTILVPEGIFAAKLAWDDRVRNTVNVFSDPNQEWRVLIRDLSGTLLQEVYSTNPGDPNPQIGPNSRSGDLTGIFQANAGQMVIVSFEQQDDQGFFNANLDNVTLLIAVLPATKDECKKGGWETFVNVNTGGQIFKNQGDCVSFVATQGTNRPAYE